MAVEGFSSFYPLFSDGTYYSFYDLARGSQHTYRRLRVFADGA